MQTGQTRSRFDMRSILSTYDIDKDVQLHLKNVYSTLSIGFLVSAAAAYLFMVSSFVQSMVIGVGLLSFLLPFGSMFYLYFTAHSRDKINSRILAFVAFAFGTGLGLGPLLRLVSILNPDTIPTALLGSAVIFVSFTLASLLTRKRYYLYLAGALLSISSTLMLFSLMNLFIRSQAIYEAELYMGLLMFCGFVVFDTQLIVEKRRHGDTDFVWHALDLFIDFIQLFRHLLLILNRRPRRDDE